MYTSNRYSINLGVKVSQNEMSNWAVLKAAGAVALSNQVEIFFKLGEPF